MNIKYKIAQNISKLEKGRINITIDKLDKIADFFEIDCYKLLK